MTLRRDAQHDELLEALANRFGRSKTELVGLVVTDVAATDRCLRAVAGGGVELNALAGWLGENLRRGR